MYVCVCQLFLLLWWYIPIVIVLIWISGVYALVFFFYYNNYYYFSNKKGEIVVKQLIFPTESIVFVCVRRWRSHILFIRMIIFPIIKFISDFVITSLVILLSDFIYLILFTNTTDQQEILSKFPFYLFFFFFVWND